jgi:amidase
MRSPTNKWPLPDATETAAMIRNKDITPLEAIDTAIENAQTLQPKLNFLVTPLFEQARERAKAGGLTGPFAGVPYMMKDMYDIKGAPTRWGSRFTTRLPIPEKNSPQVDAFESAGLIMIGKTALGEMGFLPTSEPLAFGPTRNPWNPEYSSGGSSGGAAAAVAAGVLPFADAADGGGSIRIPASACGLFGLHPSRGRLVGKQEPASGFDLTGEHCVSRTVRDSALLFAVMENKGNHLPLPATGWIKEASNRRLRVGYVVRDLNGQLPDASVQAGVEKTVTLLEELGHSVEPTSWPLNDEEFFYDFLTIWSLSALHVVELGEALSGSMPDQSVVERFTLEMAEWANKLTQREIQQTKANLMRATNAYDDWLKQFDVILSPVMRKPTVPIGYITGNMSYIEGQERLREFPTYTQLQNVAGAPAMSIPLHWTNDNLPVGMHFAARVGDEKTLFELAYELEAAKPWASRMPLVCSVKEGQAVS